MSKPSYVPSYYRLPNSDKEYLCSTSKDNGLHRCQDLPPLKSTDLTTLCQNSLPPDWHPVMSSSSSSAKRQNDSSSTNWRIPDRFIDGELVPYDLVHGDESSPFLVKQMSPLIAQSVFQPAKRRRKFVPDQNSQLPLMRQKRHDISNNNRPPIIHGPPNQNLTQHHKQHTHHDRQTRYSRKTVASSSARRLVNGTPAQKQLQGRQQQQQQQTMETSIMETNANSDQFDSISREELDRNDDKSSQRLYLRRKARKGACINWNKYYTECRAGDTNPFQGTISFDNVGMAWTAIFLVISLEGWSDIMYLLQDSHSFWVWTYFVLLIVIGSFFMINLCLVVIATQFSATKKREMERMRQERLKFSSSSTLTATSESTNCYTVIVKLIARCLRRTKISFIQFLKRRKCHRLRQKRMRERQLHNQSHQITGIHSLEGGLVGSSDCNCTSRKRSSRSAGGRSRLEAQAQAEAQGQMAAQNEAAAVAGGFALNAASRRSSWRLKSRSTKQQRPQESLASDNQMSSSPSLMPQVTASGERLIRCDSVATTNPRDQAISAALNVAPAKSRRNIKLKHADCEGSCNHKDYHVPKAGDGGRRRRRKPGGDSQQATCRHFSDDCDLDDIEIEFCPKFLSKNQGLKKLFHQANENIRHLVDHRYFQRLILLAILINAISMGIEYHNQPEQLTEAVEISNIVFACLFLVEMILKLIAHGLYNYVIDGFNCFDGCIVLLSILELFESSSNGSSGLSVLRTFRLLRILKLVRFMPALRRQLVIMLRTLDNVAVFFALLVLFIFIFSILGMNLFGCKFCETLPDGTERCDRKNFNSLLWSLVTVFQILTQEDWNVSAYSRSY